MDLELMAEKRNVGFIKEMGFTVLELEPGHVKAEMEISEKHMNPIGSVHGGVLFGLADNIGGTAAVSRGRYVTTLSGDINYLRPAIGCKKLIGESKEIKVGKNICVYDVSISNEHGIELAVCRLTYYYLEQIAGEDFL